MMDEQKAPPWLPDRSAWPWDGKRAVTCTHAHPDPCEKQHWLAEKYLQAQRDRVGGA